VHAFVESGLLSRGRLRETEREKERQRESFWDLDFASLQLAIQVLRGRAGAGKIIRDFKYGQRRWFFLVRFFFSPLHR
jgi:hypothetical protein